MKNLKTIPKFKNEKEERNFWQKHDSAEYLDWSRSQRGIFRNLKPTYKSISLRLPIHMLDEIRLLAHKQDVPYQSLLKTFLAERLKKELALQ